MNKFEVMPVSKPSRGTFRLGNLHTTTMDFGRLQPVKVMECVPNDVIKLDMRCFCQAAPNPSPINGHMTMSLHAFFVPTRIVCSEWNNYILGLSTPTLPYVTASQLDTALRAYTGVNEIIKADAKRTLSSIGIPFSYYTNTIGGSYRLSALPLRAFNRIWWDWYRDKVHISDASIASYVSDAMGACSATEVAWLVAPKYRCFNRDYITSAFDAPSEDGVMSVAPVVTDDDVPNFKVFNPENIIGARGSSSSSQTYDYQPYGVAAVGGGTTTLSNGSSTGSSQKVNLRNKTSNSADLGVNSSSLGALSVTVNSLRGAAAYQRYLERLLVSGKSVITRLKSLFNADDTPERLDMSEYLGGTSQDFTFETVTAHSAGNVPNDGFVTDNNTNAFGLYGDSAGYGNIMGQKSANGTCDLSFGGITYHAKEHGYLVVVASIMPLPCDYQGIDRMFLRGVSTGTSSRFDFFTPDMENVGFQPVLMSEVVSPMPLSGSLTASYDGLQIFGWQQRYMDYKYSHSQLSGDFCEPATAVSLQSFHLGRNILRELGFVKADGSPVTGAGAPTDYSSVTPQNLVQCDVISRSSYDDKFVMSSASVDHFLCNYKFDIKASRPMQQNALPSLDDLNDGSILNIPTGGVRL